MCVLVAPTWLRAQDLAFDVPEGDIRPDPAVEASLERFEELARDPAPVRSRAPQNARTEFFENRIETDREAFTPATKTVEQGRWLVETAYTYINNKQSPDTYAYPELLVCYGATDWLELRMGWNYEQGRGANAVSPLQSDDGLDDPFHYNRESRIYYGAKVWMTRQDGLIPRSCVIATGFTPTSGDETNTEGACTYAFGWQLPNLWRIDTAFRYMSNHLPDHSLAAMYYPSTVLRMPIGDRWIGQVEYFGLSAQQTRFQPVQNYVGPGLHYLFSADKTIGVRIGWGLNETSANFYTYLGTGARF